MGSYKQLLVLLLGIVEAYWPKLYEHKKERKDKRMNIFELNLEGTVTQNEKAQRKLKLSLKNESWKLRISSVYGYWVLCFGIKVVTKNMALFWFYIYFSMSILFEHKKVLTYLEKDVKISFHVSYHAHCIKSSHAGFIYKQKS